MPRAAPEAERARCKVKGSETVAATSLVRLYTRPTARARRAAWLLAGHGRKLLLAYEYDDGYVTSVFYRDLRLNGRFVAFVSEATDVSCKAMCPPDYNPTRTSMEVTDVRDRGGHAPSAPRRRPVAEGLAGGRGGDPWQEGSELLVLDGAGRAGCSTPARSSDVGLLAGCGSSGRTRAPRRAPT